MTTPVTVTVFTYLDPQPNASGIIEFQDEYYSCIDNTRRVIYQIFSGFMGDAGRYWLGILDMDTCTETSRVEIDLPATTGWSIDTPVSVEGSDYIVIGLYNVGVAPERYVASVNVTDGSIISVANNTLGSGSTGFGNIYTPRFTLPYNATTKIVISDIIADIINGGDAASSQLTHTAFAAHTINVTTGALALIAWGNEGPAKSWLHEAPDFLNTTGETFTFVMFPCNDVIADEASFFVRILALTDGITGAYRGDVSYGGAFGSISKEALLYKITIDDILAFTHTLTHTYIELGYIKLDGQQGVHVANENVIVSTYFLTSTPGGPVGGVDYTASYVIKVSDSGGGEILRNVVTGVTTGSSNVPRAIIYPRSENDAATKAARHIHQQASGFVWAWGANSVASGDIWKINTTTLAFTVGYAGPGLLATRYNQLPFNYTLDDARSDGQNAYIDIENNYIYAPATTGWDYQWERWSFAAVGGASPICFEIKVAQFTEPGVTGTQDITWGA